MSRPHTHRPPVVATTPDPGAQDVPTAHGVPVPDDHVPDDHDWLVCSDCGWPLEKPWLAKAIDWFIPGLTIRLVWTVRTGQMTEEVARLGTHLVEFGCLLAFLFGMTVGILLARLAWRL